ncbi:MAG: D-tagatose-bisphosphate aldolase, class II, non-catalytic subunit [Pseudomonadota bacterium]|nr:D-tagatose-bisphosphate aldolase, class II, non-catalytic subunit [Pseudomonadota bacterium]
MKSMLDMLRAHKAGHAVGVYSLCSAHPMVLEAALREAVRRDQTVLIEATANQVNQFGGYTGMTPADFRTFVEKLAADAALPKHRLLLGGDHLGPTVWRSESAEVATERAAQMIADYVAAGFRKLHLDCSMACADEPATLGDSVIASRAAELCAVAEAAWREAGGEPPVYVIGTEVPAPGGAAEALEHLAVTTSEAVDQTLRTHRTAFAARGLDDAWHRVVALVVQPGVEFDHHRVIDYAPSRSRALVRRIEHESNLVYEAHSTDYQTPAALRALVRDHFAILKVGPAVTFALREAFWALADIASEMGLMTERSLKAVMLDAMKREPKYWKPYYADADRRDFDLQFSLSDRIRYYWNTPSVTQACTQLLDELSANPVPLTLISQYLPLQYAAIRDGRLENAPRELILDGVARILRQYANACSPAG